MKFRKKPVVIEAFQMTAERMKNEGGWPPWLRAAWQSTPATFFVGVNGRPHIATLEGTHTVSWGDWIIQGVKGELYPCKPDIFAATYDPTEASDA